MTYHVLEEIHGSHSNETPPRRPRQKRRNKNTTRNTKSISPDTKKEVSYCKESQSQGSV